MPFNFFAKIRWIQVLFLSLFLLGMAASPPLVGGPAPAFQLKTVDGQTIQSADLKGQFVILNFWATWCVPCVKEMPEFQKAHQSLSRKVKIIGINLAESKEKVDAYIKAHHLSFPILLDDFGNVSQEYEVIHLPVTYFITPDGIIRDKIFGGGITEKMIEEKIHSLS
jgi:peroxiredoxin